MPRILGVDTPDNKIVGYALQYVQGIGPARANIILEMIGFLPSLRAHDLNKEHINKLISFINSAGWKIEGDLRREVIANLKRLQAMKCRHGLRHSRGLPVRSQRTSTNARPRKGTRKRVGVVKKESK
jgi:small subunit ribosomal protein S13